MSPSRGSAPPSPTVATRTADGHDWHAIGCMRRARLSGRRTIDVVSNRAATTAGTPTLFTSSGGRVEHKRRVFLQTTALPRFPYHRSLQLTLYTDRGQVWATNGHPQAMTGTTTSALLRQRLQAQSRLRDTYTGPILENSGIPESSQCAAHDRHRLIRTTRVCDFTVNVQKAFTSRVYSKRVNVERLRTSRNGRVLGK